MRETVVQIRERRECAKPIQTESSHLEKVGRVEVICRGDKVLLDRASGLEVSSATCGQGTLCRDEKSGRARQGEKNGIATTHDEAVEDVDRTRLVVGARCPCTSKWLLADDGASALVVDVEVSSGVAEQVGSALERESVRGEDGAGETVLGCGVDELAGGLKVGVLVDVHLGVGGQHRPKRTRAKARGRQEVELVRKECWLTVMTGPKISWVMETDLGSFVTMTVGWTKKPFESSPGMGHYFAPDAVACFSVRSTHTFHRR